MMRTSSLVGWVALGYWRRGFWLICRWFDIDCIAANDIVGAGCAVTNSSGERSGAVRRNRRMKKNRRR